MKNTHSTTLTTSAAMRPALTQEVVMTWMDRMVARWLLRSHARAVWRQHVRALNST